MRKLRIAIATAGRFHVLDLARELHNLGHDVKFYSYVPRSRARLFGLADQCHVSLLPFALPALAWERAAPQLAPSVRERLLYFALNRAVMGRLQPCDVFICMSGIFLEAAEFARQRYGSRIWLVRASRHILSQDEILSEIQGAARPSVLVIRRELAGYALADRIDVPSSHVEESFRRDPTALDKVIRIPYGVDLAMFPLQPEKPPGDPVIFLTVGHWSLRKGCDVLQKSVQRIDGVRLRHVGPIVDLPFLQNDIRFEHIPSVPQWKLPEIYAQADALVHASREEGFGMVITQSLASGLPVICTDRTGGADLAHTPALAARITVVPHGDVEALACAMAALRARLLAGERLPPLAEVDREALSWAVYARRYSDQLARDVESSEGR